MSTLMVQAFTVPGTQDVLLYERAESGRLIRLSCNGRTYIEERKNGRVLGENLATTTEVMLPKGLLRRVHAIGQTWTEEYLWDATGQLARVDGVEVRRDAHHRVTACLDSDGGGACDWLYAYAGDDLVVIEGPHGVRHVTRGSNGRPIRFREGDRLVQIAYDSAGGRRDVPSIPEAWHRDELGRLWTVTGSDGTVRTTYLWDGFACLGRIDGSPGAALAAVYSLDPSCTPVRVITPSAVTRIPRDAFGEGLLTHRGVPGLYGGAVYDGFVHQYARVLDPRTGAFNAPDPWHGLTDDPRRAEDYRGPLVVETPAAGPYTVCQNDPVGRTDPTGAMSIPLLLLSDFTWSLQNNLSGWLVVDGMVNFWGSLVTGNIGRFFSAGGLSSSRLGSFGVRRDGLLYFGRAYTYQHTVWSSSEDIDELDDVRVFDPRAEFRPSLYGTLLRAVPENGAPFVLRGSGNTGVNIPPRAPGWTREGGKAEPVIPGSPVPHFPAGGIHFDTVRRGLDNDILRRGLRGPQPGVLTELEPTGVLGIGTIGDRAMIILPATGLGLNTNSLVLLTDAGAGVVITRVLSAVLQGQATRVLLEVDATSPGVGPNGVRLRGLGAPSASETLNAVSPNPSPGNTHLDTSGTSAAYAKGDPLRLSQGPARVGAALIQRLESRVRIDAPLPGSLAPPLNVTIASPTGAPSPANLTADAQVLEFPAGQPIPAIGDTIAVARGANEVAVVVTASPAASQRRMDRNLSALGAAGAVTWRRLVRGAEVGTRAGTPETDPVVTYEANTVRTAPSGGFVRIEAGSGGLAVRAVIGLAYDALALGAALPGNPANPYGVERFSIQPPDQGNLTIAHLQTLALDPSVTLDGVALHLHQLAGSAVAAGTASVPATTVSGSVASATLATGALGPTPTAGQLVVLRQGTAVEPAVVSQVRATVTFDRDLRLGASGLQVVPLVDGSPAYRAVRQGPRLATVLPEVAATRVQMPRFREGELVEASWTGATRSHHYRVAADPEGTTLALEGDDDLPAATPALTITRLVPGDPRTGGSRAGIEGVPVNLAPDGTTRQVRFRVWQPDALPPGTRVGIVDGSTTRPAVVDATASRDLEIEFAAAPGLAGAGVDITLPALNGTGYAASFTQEGAAVLINDAPPPLAAPGTDLIVAVPFKETSRRAAGQLSPGTVLVPEDPEGPELTRRDGLITHELRHTQQWAMWGQAFLSWFPLWALELGLELGTDVEMPQYSPYVDGVIEIEGANSFLSVPSSPGITFEVGNHVQISAPWLDTPMSRILKAGENNRFRIALDGLLLPPPPANQGEDPVRYDVEVRREKSSTGWANFLEVMQFLTVGGLVNISAGTQYGGLIFGLSRLIYALTRLIGGPGDNYPATVETGGITLRLSTEAGRSALRGASRVLVQDPSGNRTVVRSVDGAIEEGVVRLTSTVNFSGEVRVAPYSAHTPDSYWDWHDYFPARVPDPGRPASIEIFPVGNKTLELAPHDRVTVTADGTVWERTNVTAVAAGRVELEEPPPFSGAERDFRIAKVFANDPMGNADSVTMRLMGFGWLRTVLDPYGQLHFRLQPQHRWLDVLLRIVRYTLGSQSWSATPPGWLFWDRALGREHLSQIEQDASEESGDLYSPVGRLRGPTAVVGDVARYWYFHLPRDYSSTASGARDYRYGTLILEGRQDAPGVHIKDIPRVAPSVVVPPTPGAPEPNRGAQAGPDPGRDVPDVLFTKNNATPNSANATDPNGFAPAFRGWVPTSPVLERACGVYTAFVREGTHRITIRNFGAPLPPGQGPDVLYLADRGREAQEGGTSFVFPVSQTLFFDVPVQPVTVSVAGLAIGEGGTIQLVQTQRATVAVAPNADRRYAVSLTQPDTSDVLRADGDLAIVAQRLNSATAEPVEISRVYRYDAARDAFDSGGLVQHGLHLPTDVHIPVRNFNIQVVNTLPVRNSISTGLGSIVTTSRLPGQEVFVLVPAAILSPLRLSSPSGAGAPNLTIGVETVPEAVRAFVGDGGIFKITFPANDPPEEPADLLFRVDVGVPGRSATLEARVQLTPHFRLVPQGGGTSFQVARGATITLTCTDGVNAGTVVVTPAGGVTTTVAGTDVVVTVEAGAAVGPHRILVDDAANPLRKARRTIEIV